VAEKQIKYGISRFQHNRKRVRGFDGPDRRRLPSTKLLGNVGEGFINNYLEYIAQLPVDYNDMLDEDYGISQNCPLSVGDMAKGEGPLFDIKKLRHIMFQGAASSDPELINDEENYTKPIRPALLEPITTICSEFYRARLSIIPPDYDIPWHIDTNTSVSCRLSILLCGEQEWMTRRRGRIEKTLMKPGEIWFVNAGWPHMIKNRSNSEGRVSVLLSTKWKNISKYFPEISV
jgi:hypothetical protein